MALVDWAMILLSLRIRRCDVFYEGLSNRIRTYVKDSLNIFLHVVKTLR